MAAARTTLTFLLLLLASLGAVAADYPPHGVVLMYHRFGEASYPSTNVQPEQFEAQLDYLQQEGFQIWPLRRLVHTMFNGGTIPDKTVALSVDDAYLSVYENAYPIVKARGLPLTVFVSTDAIDRGLHGFISWEQMREMQAHGIDFANHGASHRHLVRRLAGEAEEAWQERASADIGKARQRLEQELGADTRALFAYPFGEFDNALGAIVRKMGYIGFGQQSGAIGRHSDLRALPRFPINEQFSVLEKFAIKVASLPLPLAGPSLQNPLLGEENPPRLELQLAAGEEKLSGRIGCFLGDGTPLETVERGTGTITVQAARPLSQGRSRYNCTAPAGDGRFYWFSQPWLNGPDPADPGY